MPLLSAHQHLATFITTALHTIAREERRGRKTARLTEPGLATWRQFQGRLSTSDLIDLLLEDARVTQPFAFDPHALGVPHADTPTSWRALGEPWLGQLIQSLHPSDDHIHAQAHALGLPTRLAKSSLPLGIKPHHRVLELPGSGGQLSHHLVNALPELSLREVFTIACASWQERLLAACVAVEANIEGSAPMILDDPELALVRKLHLTQPFDYIIGLDPDKGGAFTKATLQAALPPLGRDLLIALV